jgi:hypothetical protein
VRVQVEDGGLVVLACGAAPAPTESVGRRVVRVPSRPGRTDVDPLLPGARRLVVVGDDADLAAVLTRLLRAERLDVELALVSATATAATRAWGLPHSDEAARLAVTGTATASPLVRDDHGGVLVGVGELRGVDGAPLRGEAYCDDARVFSGDVAGVVVHAGPTGVSARVATGRFRRQRPELVGRALQLGCVSGQVVHDGVVDERPVTRWAFYRHVEDWLLVR